MNHKFNKFKKILRWVLVIVSIAYIVRFFYKNKDSLEIAFTVDITTMLSIITITVLYLVLTCYRFQIVLEKCSGSRLPLWAWFRIFILGRFLNTLFPQMGNVYRSVRLKKDHNISYTRYISSFTSFAWMDTCINLVIVTAIIRALSSDLQIGAFSVWKSLLVITAAVVIVPLLAEALFSRIKFKNAYLAWIHSKLSEVLTVSVQNLKDTVYLLKIVLVGFIVLICVGGIFYYCFLVFNVRPSLPVLAVFYALLKLSTYVSLTPGNIGVQELAYGFLGEQMGIGMAQGVLVFAFLRVVGTAVLFVLAMLLGGGGLLRHRKDYSKEEE